MSKPVVKMLWVEDNIGSILLIKEAFEQAGLNHRLNVVNDGEEATNFLFHRGRYAHVHRPDLVILDLNLPKKSGREVIAEIKTDPVLLGIPMVVLTSSSHDQDVLEGYDPKRCLYLTKPSSFTALVDMAKKIHTFWLELTDLRQEP